jgi:hypothetical protein
MEQTSSCLKRTGMDNGRAIRHRNLSFIVRLWPCEGRVGEMCGEVEHIGTGEKRLFMDHQALISLLQSWEKDLAEAR